MWYGQDIVSFWSLKDNNTDDFPIKIIRKVQITCGGHRSFKKVKERNRFAVDAYLIIICNAKRVTYARYKSQPFLEKYSKQEGSCLAPTTVQVTRWAVFTEINCSICLLNAIKFK